MARGGKAADLRAAKERKQKKIAIVGGILLVAIRAFQVPRTMKMLNGGDTPPADSAVAAPAPAPAGPVTLEPPSLAGNGAAPAPASSGGKGLSADPAPLAAAGQLVSFSLFESKDPFAQQVGKTSVGSPQPAKPAAPSAPSAPKLDGGAITPETSPLPLAAVIAVDGTAETVAPGKDFPAESPLFTLVSLTRTTAAIAVAGGSYADGASTVKLRRGKSLTLMNTADGTRYELKLVSFIWGSAPES
jgi:hypothetical protein